MFKKRLSISNQKEKSTIKKRIKCCHCGSIKPLWIIFKDLPMGIAIRKARILALDMKLFQAEEKTQYMDQHWRKKTSVWWPIRLSWPQGREKKQSNVNIVCMLRRLGSMHNHVRGQQWWKWNILWRMRQTRQLGRMKGLYIRAEIKLC